MNKTKQHLLEIIQNQNKINNLPQELKLHIYRYFVWTPKNKNNKKML